MGVINEKSLRQQWLKLKEEGKIKFGYENFCSQIKKYGSVDKLLKRKETRGIKKKYDYDKIIEFYYIYGPFKTAKKIGCSEDLVFKVMQKVKKGEFKK